MQVCLFSIIPFFCFSKLQNTTICYAKKNTCLIFLQVKVMQSQICMKNIFLRISLHEKEVYKFACSRHNFGSSGRKMLMATKCYCSWGRLLKRTCENRYILSDKSLFLEVYFFHMGVLTNKKNGGCNPISFVVMGHELYI